MQKIQQQMPKKTRNTTEAFVFNTKLELREVTGLRAGNIKELQQYLNEVPESVIYHHTHRYLQQHQFNIPSPPNDFSYWVTEMIGLRSLGEELASINTHEFESLGAIRHKFIEILGNYLKKRERQRYCAQGEEFHFIKSISFVFPTHYQAVDLHSFVEGLKHVSVDSLYFHMFEAKLRLKKGDNDFSYWLETSMLEGNLAKKISQLDPYSFTMDTLRKKIVDLVNMHITGGSKG